MNFVHEIYYSIAYNNPVVYRFTTQNLRAPYKLTKANRSKVKPTKGTIGIWYPPAYTLTNTQKKKIKKKNLKNITKGVPIPGSVILLESKGAPRV